MIKFFRNNWLKIFLVALLVVLGVTFIFLNPTGHTKPVPQEVIDRLSVTLTDPYSIKDGKIYYQDALMGDVDIVTFKVLSNRSFSKDKNHVYYVTAILEGADAPTFEFFYKEFLARDKNRVYWNENPINGSDPQTFALIEGGYGKDKAHIFLETEMVQGANPATFEPIGIVQMGYDGAPYTSYGTYSKDTKFIYFKTEAVPNSDPATFEPFLKDGGHTLYFKDKNLVYHSTDGALQGSDPTTFEMLRSGYAHDAHAAYYISKSIPLTDLATFRVLGDGYAEDKNHLYYQGDAIFDLSEATNPFEQAVVHLLDITPKGDVAIDYIVNTYYDLTLYYGNYSEYNIFGNDDIENFFAPLFKGLKRSTFDLATFVPFRLAFVAPNSPASLFEFPQPIGPGIGGEVVGRKLLDSDTMLVYARYERQGYLGPSAYMCKESMDNIDKFIFKKVKDEWKIWEIEELIDKWVTHGEGATEEECKGINQDKIEKYRINQNSLN